MSRHSSHIPVIDVLRGIAASMVCFFHFVCETIGFIHTDWVLHVFHFGSKGVQVFFVISGIVIPLSMINAKYTLSKWHKFILRRFVRIEPPYLIAVLVGVFYLFIRNYVPNTVEADLFPSGFEIILHIGYLIPFFEGTSWINPVFWTLAIEFQYYLFLSILFPLLLSNKLWARILFYGTFLTLPFLGFENSFFTFWSAYFLFGILYVLWFKKIIGLWEFMVLMMIDVLLIYQFYGIEDLIFAVFTLLIIHFLYFFKFKLGVFIGKISYSLYLLHSIVGAACVNYLSHYVTVWYWKIALILVGYGISVFGAWVMYILIENPSHKFAKKRIKL